MKKLNPLQEQYLRDCQLLEKLNLPTDSFNELYKMHSSELYKELTNKIKGNKHFKINN